MNKLTLPYPPSANRYWRVRAMGRGPKAIAVVYQSAEAKQYKKKVFELVGGQLWIPASYDVEVHVDVYRPRKSGDLDNSLKVTLDALKGIAYDDDKRIKRIIANQFDDKHNPRVEVEVLPL